MPKQRTASERLLRTDQPTNVLFASLKSALEQHKYHVQHEDPAAGLLVMSPRAFSYSSGGRKNYAHQLIQIRQEGGSIKVRLNYECSADGVEGPFKPCLEGDEALSQKVNRIESSFFEIVNPLLIHKTGS
jgi:hypothetical protein